MAISSPIAGVESEVFAPVSARIPCALRCDANPIHIIQLCYVNVYNTGGYQVVGPELDLSLFDFYPQQAGKAVRKLATYSNGTLAAVIQFTHDMIELSSSSWQFGPDARDRVIAQNGDQTNSQQPIGSQRMKTKCRLIGPARGVITFHGTIATIIPAPPGEDDFFYMPGQSEQSELAAPSGGNPILLWDDGIQTGSIIPVDGIAEVNLADNTQWADFTPDDLCPPGSDLTCFAIFWIGKTPATLPSFPAPWVGQFELF